MTKNDLETALLLNRIPFCDARRIQLLTQSLGSLSELLHEDILSFIAQKNSFGKRLVAAIRKERLTFDLEQERLYAEENNISLVAYMDPRYPQNLLEIHDPPVLLYVAGNVDALHNRAVAIVGSRTASFYGKEMAREIASVLTFDGVTVVSGLARGIDTEAHRAAVKTGGYTVAVLGSGLDVIYPRENKDLYAAICEKGAVVSEYPFGTEPYPYNFPKRNRIISGLAQGVLVVEAAKRSGSLITARSALDEGRDVFCVPGKANAIQAQGTNNLIKQGAKLVTSAEEILEDLYSGVGAQPITEECDAPCALAVDELDLFTRQIFAMIENKPITVDALLCGSEASSPDVLTALTKLEIARRIKRDHYGGYVRV